MFSFEKKSLVDTVVSVRSCDVFYGPKSKRRDAPMNPRPRRLSGCRSDFTSRASFAMGKSVGVKKKTLLCSEMATLNKNCPCGR